MRRGAKKVAKRDDRPCVCPGCYWTLVKQRRARAGGLCVDCRADRAPVKS